MRLVCLFLLMIPATLAICGNDPIQKHALLSFFEATNGPNWTYNLGFNLIHGNVSINSWNQRFRLGYNKVISHSWNTTDDYCTWYGVGCNCETVISNISTSSVIVLYLPNVTLNGFIPQNFGDLVDLRSLDLSNNPGLTGKMHPTTLIEMKHLTILNLAMTNLRGSLPRFYNGCGALTVVNISQTQFTSMTLMNCVLLDEFNFSLQ